jgi:hypothetical protein
MIGHTDIFVSINFEKISSLCINNETPDPKLSMNFQRNMIFLEICVFFFQIFQNKNGSEGCWSMMLRVRASIQYYRTPVVRTTLTV